MNLDNAMERLWANHNQLKQFTHELDRSGFAMAHSEMDREQMKLGNCLLQMEAVIEAYQKEIATVADLKRFHSEGALS